MHVGKQSLYFFKSVTIYFQRLSADARKSSSGAEDSVIQEDSDLVGIGAILVMCKRLAHAAASLMHWATAAQRELVKQGRLRAVSENVDETEAESQWTCGLVSAVSLAYLFNSWQFLGKLQSIRLL